MRHRLTAAALLGALTLLQAACAGAQAPRPAEASEARGERLYREHCGACHRLRSPSEQTREGWARAVERFGPRAHLAEADRPPVLEYLQARAKDAPPPSSPAR
jgi:mono/diheme cytochrome c family protein